MSTEFINFLAPPGASIANYNRKAVAQAQPHGIPSTFIEAMNVRESVFVKEQQVPLENEFDQDDARSYHWVVYASVHDGSRHDNGRKGSQTSTVPVGTIRLVPPPHPPHPKSGSIELTNNSQAGQAEQQETLITAWHNGKEPYIKLGRLATLKSYRKLGLARLLLFEALDWASKNADAFRPSLSVDEYERARQKDWDWLERVVWKGLVLVHAQKDVEVFYQRQGFVTDEEMGSWTEEGIIHVGMWRRIPLVETKSRRKS